MGGSWDRITASHSVAKCMHKELLAIRMLMKRSLLSSGYFQAKCSDHESSNSQGRGGEGRGGVIDAFIQIIKIKGW